MDKSAIKNFAIEARKILMKSAITQACFYGITEKGCNAPIQTGPGFEVYKTVAGTETRIFREDMARRRNLVQAIENKGFNQVIEETAYTWFNRLIAIRFMEVNDYLPTRVRVLSSETGSNTPDVVSQFYDVELNLTQSELDEIQEAIDDNRYDDAFARLFVKQCNELNDILPGLFEKTNDYMELLLKLSYTSDGVVRMLVDTIPENNFRVKTDDEDTDAEGQVEIIGWLYQYYNTEPKSAAFAKKGKITKEEIPAVTQLFTPDWIVRYMVENSLGRLWTERNMASGVDEEISDTLKSEWKYYLEEAEQEESVQKELTKIRDTYKGLNPEDIKLIDPCMGSGHILVYAFDVLMQIYESCGYRAREAVASILENNIYGLDIDDRAYQMAYFAIMMKARQYDKRFLKRDSKPVCHLYSIQESNPINKNHLKFFGASLSEAQMKLALKQMQELLKTFVDAKEYGSILNVPEFDWVLLHEFVTETNEDAQMDFESYGLDKTKEQLVELINIATVMVKKYHVVITNPPYMGVSNAGAKLAQFVKKYYPQNKVDLFSVFMEKTLAMCNIRGYCALITQQTWMFISSFINTRKMITSYQISSLCHLGTRAFEEISGEVVQSVSYCLRKEKVSDYKAAYIKLDDVDNKEKTFLMQNSRYDANTELFEILPDGIIAYWLSDKVINNFSRFSDVATYAVGKIGLQTGDNNRFLRLWQEIDATKLTLSGPSSTQYWVPYNKAGSYRKWYGNHDYVLFWQNDGLDIVNCRDENGKQKSRPQNREYYFKSGITWSDVCTGMFSMRAMPSNFVFDSCAPSIFSDEQTTKYLLGLYNSKVAQLYLDFLTPTIHYTCGSVLKVPMAIDKSFDLAVIDNCINLVKEDWDLFENSWEFAGHPLTRYGESSLKKSYEMWSSFCDRRYSELKEYETIINKHFIELYKLNDELDPFVSDDSVSVRRADEKREVISLISYAVGCMFGRYSLDVDGLAYAGGAWDSSKYASFIPDTDGIIPITEEPYLSDDIVTRFCEWLTVVYGADTLEDNLDFIAKALGGKGKSSREIIRKYFLNYFFKDHCQTYSVSGSGKRPIYWLFDSGKQNGFKALIYLHRYNKDTVGTVRSVYLKQVQEAIEASLKNAEYIISSTSSAMDRANATRKRDTYIKQLAEIRTYYQALSHVALQRIELDLDDGVKVNYAKFQGIEIVNESGKKQKIDLLAKI